MAIKNYTINFVDPTKSTITILANTSAGPNGGVRYTDLDLIGMGSSLWGEKILENLVHLLENFASDEDPGNPGNPVPIAVNGVSFGSTPIEGQLWYNQTNSNIYVYETSGSPSLWKRVGGVVVDAFAPLNPSQGDLWYDTGSPGSLNIYITGTGWSPTVGDFFLRDGSLPMGGNIDMAGNLINFLDDPATAQDAMTLNYADTNYVNTNTSSPETMGSNLIINRQSPQFIAQVTAAGSADQFHGLLIKYDNGSTVENTADFAKDLVNNSLTITNRDLNNSNIVTNLIFEGPGTNVGNIKLPNGGTPLANDHLIRKDYVDNNFLDLNATNTMNGILDMGSNKITNLAIPTVTQDAMQFGFADGRYLRLTGGSMTGLLDMGTNQIKSLLGPTVDSDASTKKYVDDQVTAIPVLILLSPGVNILSVSQGSGSVTYQVDPTLAGMPSTATHVLYRSTIRITNPGGTGFRFLYGTMNGVLMLNGISRDGAAITITNQWWSGTLSPTLDAYNVNQNAPGVAINLYVDGWR